MGHFDENQRYRSGYDGEHCCASSLWEQFSSYSVHHFTSPEVFVPIWTGSFLIVG
jgi:hypothetical protein